MHQASVIPVVPAEVAIELAIRRTTQELERRAHERDARLLHELAEQLAHTTDPQVRCIGAKLSRIASRVCLRPDHDGTVGCTIMRSRRLAS